MSPRRVPTDAGADPAAAPRTGPTDFERDVAAVLDSLEAGDLVTYGEVAVEAGHPGAARAVGSLLRHAPAGRFPWWRVVTATGRLVPGAEARHSELLRAEGWAVHDDRVRAVQ